MEFGQKYHAIESNFARSYKHLETHLICYETLVNEPEE